MAKEAARRFFESIKDDRDVAQQFEKATTTTTFSSLAVRLGRDRGFDFTGQEVELLLVEAAGASRALSDDELENVAGGIAFIGTSDCSRLMTLYTCVDTGGCVKVSPTMGCISIGGCTS